MLKSKDKPIYVKADAVLKLGQRVEISLPGDTRAFASRLEDMRESAIVLAMPLDEKRMPVVISPGSQLTCKAFDGRCYYRFGATYKELIHENIQLWVVTRPIDVQKIQYRDYVRVKTTQPLVVRPVLEDGTLEPMVFTSTLDLSGGGVCFAMDRPLPVGSKATVEMDNIPGVGLLQLMCRVARCIEVDVKGTKVYQTGVEFLNINRTVQNKLIKFIFDLQRDGLAKGIDDL